MRSARKETRRGGKIGGNVRQEKGEKKQVVWLVVENLAP
jgi:hypothetical protein